VPTSITVPIIWLSGEMPEKPSQLLFSGIGLLGEKVVLKLKNRFAYDGGGWPNGILCRRTA